MLGGSSSGGASLLGKLLDQRRPAALLLAALAGVAITAVFDRQHLRQAAPVPANLSNEGLGFAALRKPVPTPQPRPDAWWTACHAQLMSEVEVADDEGKVGGVHARAATAACGTAARAARRPAFCPPPSPRART